MFKRGVIVTVIGLVGMQINIDVDTTPGGIATGVQMFDCGSPWYDSFRQIDHAGGCQTIAGWVGQECKGNLGW